jgi:DNA-binding CsgD family transcriptional regulator
MPSVYDQQTPYGRSTLGHDFGSRAFRFAEDAQRCVDMRHLSEVAQDAVAIVGMTAVASGIVSGPKRTGGDPFHFVNWPVDWLELYLSEGYVDKDPVPRWAVVSGAPISWTQLLKGLPADDPGREIYRNAAKLGFTEGFVTPSRAIDGSLGLVSVGGDRGELLPQECLYLQSVSVHIFQRAEAISRSISIPADAMSATLQSRESDAGQKEQGTQEEKLKARYSLTSAEWRVALALYKGESLQGISATHNIRVNTLRVQLASVYAKTRTHRQIELVAAIRNALDAQ